MNIQLTNQKDKNVIDETEIKETSPKELSQLQLRRTESESEIERSKTEEEQKCFVKAKRLMLMKESSKEQRAGHL